MDIDTAIFKAYDIRGVYPVSLNEEIVYKIARGYTEILKRENPGKNLTVVVGRDMRLSSEMLAAKVTEGLVDAGVNVVDIGLSSTPTFYFAVGFGGYDGGLEVSASHLGKEYNGLKIVRARAVPVSGESGIYEVRDMVLKNQFEPVSAKGTVTKIQNVLSDLVREQSKGIDLGKIKPFKIVVDTANAMGILDIEAMLAGLPCQLTKLNEKLDGNFPSHPADPLKEGVLEALKKEVVENRADLGIAIDGDGDRYFFIDDTGKMVNPAILRGIMAQICLKEQPGEKVCYDIRPGRITRDMIEAVGGKGIVTKAGHSLIKEAMIAEKAVFGGESSGHFYFKQPYGTFEAPAILMWKFLGYLSEQNKPLSEVIRPFEIYFHSGEINETVADKEAIMKEIAEKYSDGQISYLDGVSVEYPDFWFNVRPSNTEPLLRLNLEARSRELMEQKRDEVLELMRAGIC